MSENQEQKNKWQDLNLKDQHDDEEVNHVDLEDDKLSIEGEDDSLLDFSGTSPLEKKLAASEKQAELFQQKALRAAAELENIKKRSNIEVQNAHKFALEKFMKALMPVLDSLERGVDACGSDDAGAQSAREGMQLTLKLFEETMQKFGATEIAPQAGDKFDPDMQQAMSMQPSAEIPAQCVVQTLQKGYALNGRVLRPAMVIISQG